MNQLAKIAGVCPHAALYDQIGAKPASRRTDTASTDRGWTAAADPFIASSVCRKPLKKLWPIRFDEPMPCGALPAARTTARPPDKLIATLAKTIRHQRRAHLCATRRSFKGLTKAD